MLTQTDVHTHVPASDNEGFQVQQKKYTLACGLQPGVTDASFVSEYRASASLVFINS